MILRIVIEGKPKATKNGKRIVKFGKRSALISSKDAMTWRRSAVEQIKAQIPKDWQPITPKQGAVVELRVYQGSRQSIDVDNAVSSVFDAMEKAGVLSNDYAIVSGSFWRGRDTARPRVEVMVERGADVDGNSAGE
jgi:Holliday junction resolvase RusA-like endonuclease